MTPNIFPVILAGGSGTRLWPLSRKNFPKQFLCLEGQQSLLQLTFARALSLPFQKILIVSNDAHYFLCQEQLQTNDKLLTYLLEPFARNTAPAIAAAAEYLLQNEGSDSVMLVMPSDHLIKNTEPWRDYMLRAADIAAADEVIISFGITPDSPQTGYGYIKAGEKQASETYRVASFHEKPDVLLATQMIASKNYFWNSGMLACRAGLYLDELKLYAPDIVAASSQAVAKAYQHHDFIRLDETAMSECRSESNDYALMEHTQKALVMPLALDWTDLGCWASVAQVNSNDKDASGNILRGNVIIKDSQNCFVRSEHPLVTTMGIQDVIIVATSDAVLVADKKYSQQVKDLVENLREKHQAILDDHPRVPRPWGHYEILAEGPSFKVKRLMVYAGSSLSLQIHQHRAEHWVVVAGQADIINGDQQMRLTVNQSTYIPKNTRHRLTNRGDEPLFVIEVQSGDYLGEDDIQRLDDRYQRAVPS